MIMPIGEIGWVKLQEDGRWTGIISEALADKGVIVHARTTKDSEPEIDFWLRCQLTNQLWRKVANDNQFH